MKFKKFYKTKRFYLLFSLTTTFIIVFAIQLFGILDSIELTTIDIRNNFAAGIFKADTNIVMVTIDDNSLKFFENNEVSWPFPREFYAQVNNFLTFAGAKAIIFDIHLSSKEIERLDVDPEESEYKFIESIKRNGKVYLIAGLTQKKGRSEKGNELLQKFIFKNNIDLHINSYSELEAPLITFQEGAAGVGIVTLVTDNDNIIRRIPLLFKYNDIILPQISYLVYSELNHNNINDANKLLNLPIDKNGNIIIRWYGGGGVTGNIFNYYSIKDLIISGYRLSQNEETVINPNIFKDKIVFVGGTAHGLGDFKSVAINSEEPYPGMEIHATLLSNLLNRHFITSASFLINLLFLLFVCLTIPATLIFIKKVYISLPIYILLGCFITYVNIYIYAKHGYYLNFVYPELAIILGFLITALVLYISEGKQKNEIRKTFNRYMSPMVIEEILRNPDSIELGGREVFATVFFSDIKEFTNISERYTPSELVKHLNEYFSNASSIILEQKAMLDKYIGDAIMAVFGAPVYQENHAIAACKAALKIQNQLDILYSNVSENKPKFITRMGLNSGKMIIGNIGTSSRLDYTAIGDAVNTASRMEGLNKIYGTRIIISESTYELVKDLFEVRKLDLIAVKGKSIPIKIYELICESGMISKEEETFRDRFEYGLNLYQNKNFEKALLVFNELSLDKNNLSVNLYIDRCKEFIKNPPNNNWDGVFYAKIK
ncbi:MAG TPA: adenylate/guanylate cyclase domain-containing protein [Melioribacteraceae bacterium]|nr:adenylate/guanylate cyclase domain-containing protein [Melioribacteraceae bacterium]